MTAGDTSRAAASSRCDQPGGVQPGDELLPAPGPQAEAHIAAGQPVISVDGKKKELVGNFSNGGRDYRPVGEPVQTNIYDFKGELGKVTPYGVYDMAANTG
jgi:Rhodopirellula transposase DDE domain